MGRELEQESRPIVRPWKAPLKLRMERLGEPGASFWGGGGHNMDKQTNKQTNLP